MNPYLIRDGKTIAARSPARAWTRDWSWWAPSLFLEPAPRVLL